MSDDLRYQRKCYYASDAYARSFWGRFIYLYQGKGGLRLTRRALVLEGCPRALEIPFEAIKSISLDRFSTWAKPLGLSRLTVSFAREGEIETIHLVPHESGFDPTPVTSELVASWFETLGGVEGLANRVVPPSNWATAPPAVRPGVLILGGALLSLAVAGLILQAMAHRGPGGSGRLTEGERGSPEPPRPVPPLGASAGTPRQDIARSRASGV